MGALYDDKCLTEVASCEGFRLRQKSYLIIIIHSGRVPLSSHDCATEASVVRIVKTDKFLVKT